MHTGREGNQFARKTGETLRGLLIHYSLPGSIQETASPRLDAPNHGTFSPDCAVVVFGMSPQLVSHPVRINIASELLACSLGVISFSFNYLWDPVNSQTNPVDCFLVYGWNMGHRNTFVAVGDYLGLAPISEPPYQQADLSEPQDIPGTTSIVYECVELL